MVLFDRMRDSISVTEADDEEKENKNKPEILMPESLSQKTKRAVMILGSAIIAALLFEVILSGGGCEKPIKNLEKGINEMDFKLISEAFADGNILSYTNEFPFLDGLPRGLGIDIDYDVELKVVSREKLKKAEMEEILDDEYHINKEYAQTAAGAYILGVKGNFRVGEEETEKEMEIPVIKLDGKWVIPENLTEFYDWRYKRTMMRRTGEKMQMILYKDISENELNVWECKKR